MKKACRAAAVLFLSAAMTAAAGATAKLSCTRVDSPVLFAPLACGRNLLFFGVGGKNLVMTREGKFSFLEGPPVSPSFQPVSDGESVWVVAADGSLIRIAKEKAARLPGDFKGALALLPADPLPYALFPGKLKLPDGGEVALDFTASAMNAVGNNIWISGKGVAALADSKGSILWKRTIPGASAGPALLVGKTIFVGVSNGSFSALKKRNGKRIFSFKGGGSAVNRPVACGKFVVYGSTDHFVRALDRRSGRVVWQTRVEGRPSFGPLKVKAGLLFAEGAGARLFILSEKDGRAGWNWKVPSGAILKAPVVIDNTAFVLVWDGSSNPCLYRLPLPDNLPKHSSKKGKAK